MKERYRLKSPIPIFSTAHSGKGHQGVAAEVSAKGYISLDELLEIPSKKNELPFFLILDCIEDPRNFGAILKGGRCRRYSWNCYPIAQVCYPQL